ncbi:TRAP transporter substrate-binding protein [Pueribacillus theae]|nr:TRAP transporter substrate-binding protein DctP [Pueribacillus theae]
MKNYFSLKFLLMASIIVILAACGNNSEKSASDSSSNQSKEVIELNYNNLATPTHPYTKEIVEPWIEYVDEVTDGRVKINQFPNAALGSPASGYDDISGGVFEIGLLYPATDSNDILFPLTIANLPFAIETPNISVSVMNKYFDKYMKDTFKDDVVWLGASSTDTAQLYSTDPIEKVEDLKHRKISSTFSVINSLIQNWEASPVNVSNTELYESVEKGMVDDVIYNTTGAIGFNLNEVTSHLIKLDLGTNNNGLFINANIFNKMPEDIQQLFIEKIGPKHQDLMAELYTKSMENSITEFENRVKDKGGSVIIPNEEELTKFKEPAKKVWDDWVKRANEKGYPGEEMMDYFKQLLKEEGSEVPF